MLGDFIVNNIRNVCGNSGGTCGVEGCRDDPDYCCKCSGFTELFCAGHLSAHLDLALANDRPRTNCYYLNETVKQQLCSACNKCMQKCENSLRKLGIKSYKYQRNSCYENIIQELNRQLRAYKNIRLQIQEKYKIYIYYNNDLVENCIISEINNPGEMEEHLDSKLYSYKHSLKESQFITRAEFSSMISQLGIKAQGLLIDALSNPSLNKTNHDNKIANKNKTKTKTKAKTKIKTKTKNKIKAKTKTKTENSTDREKQLENHLKVSPIIAHMATQFQALQSQFHSQFQLSSECNQKLQDFQTFSIHIERSLSKFHEEISNLYLSCSILNSTLNTLNSTLSSKISSLKSSNTLILSSINQILSTLSPTPCETVQFSSFYYCNEGSKSLLKVAPEDASDELYYILPDTISTAGGWCQLPQNRLFYYGSSVSGILHRYRSHFFYIIDLAQMRVYKQEVSHAGNNGLCCYLRNSVYIFGVVGSGDTMNKALVLDLGEMKAKEICDLPSSVCNIASLVWENSIFITGLYTDKLFAYSVEEQVYYCGPLRMIENRNKIIFECAGRMFIIADDDVFEVFRNPQGHFRKIFCNLPFRNRFLKANTVKNRQNVYMLLNDNTIYKFSLTTLSVQKIRQVTVCS